MISSNLNTRQLEALQKVKEGKSIFITGAGGTGKSYLIKSIINEIRNKTIATVAMTGCAAILLGCKAKTLHSWASIGLGKESAIKLATDIRRGRGLRRWITTDILIIDEVSMLTLELFEKLNEIGRIIRRNNKMFGGIQIVLVGDFFQLPPVFKDIPQQKQKLVFESTLWNDVITDTIHLTEIIRQQDPVFQEIITEARIGKLSEKSIEILKSRVGLSWKELQITPTLLYSTKTEVDAINENNLKLLKNKRLYKAEIVDKTAEILNKSQSHSKIIIDKAIEKMDKNAQYMPELILADGAQVMLIKNLSEHLVNGSRGVIIGFTDMGIPIVKFKNGIEEKIQAALWESDEIDGLYRKQIPLRLAYALTIHKSQGSTLDCALIDIGTCFEDGQAYVALSRVKDLESLYIWDVEPTAFKVNEKVLKFYSSQLSL